MSSLRSVFALLTSQLCMMKIQHGFVDSALKIELDFLGCALKIKDIAYSTQLHAELRISAHFILFT